jgi:hypothetical protein
MRGLRFPCWVVGKARSVKPRLRPRFHSDLFFGKARSVRARLLVVPTSSVMDTGFSPDPNRSPVLMPRYMPAQS